MNVFREMQNEIEEFFHSGRLTKAVLWLCVAFFPLYLTLACNFLSYSSGDKLYALVHEQTGSFVFGLFLVVLVFFGVCLSVPQSVYSGVGFRRYFYGNALG